ncbi:MAG: hypothetical protein SFV51_13335, partial [Bryobacteraceae bacterium]|nr:hypothetical protein [Bryobacteraceae bacterium]
MEPALSLGPGPHHPPSSRAAFGAFGDSAPDRWGRVLMRREERRRAERERRHPRSLAEIDFLLMVDDEARLGALRFSATDGGPFLESPQPDRRIPPFVDCRGCLRPANESSPNGIPRRIFACYSRRAPHWAERGRKPVSATGTVRSLSRSFLRNP